MINIARPIDGVKKDHDIRVRIDSDLNDKLLEYCTRNGTDRAKTIRVAIREFMTRENETDAVK